MNHIDYISKILQLPNKAVGNTIKLLDEGATIPFISRYRKEATGSLDEVQIAKISKAWKDFNDLLKRKEFILKSIQEQKKLTPELKTQIESCLDINLLEDIYLPFKKKRKTRAAIAKENGLSELAEIIWRQDAKNLDRIARGFLNKKVATVDEALQGARDILAERINEGAPARELVRKLFKSSARIQSKVVKKKKEEAIKYADYFDFEESLKRAAAHRLLAVFRAEKEGFLKVKINVDTDNALDRLERLVIKRHANYECEDQLRLTIKDAYNRLLQASIETEFRKVFKEKADEDAIDVFTANLKQLLLAAPLGNKAILGIDPGFRSGCKLVCLDEQGSLKYNTTIYPHPPQKNRSEAEQTIKKLVDTYKIAAVAIGNGTAGKETYAFVKSALIGYPVELYMVNENGASIYSASEIARKEFPNHDLTVRGAVSIGRRLMDPLSELVKIDPKSIGVGQYQHDVNQAKLKDNLKLCVESCVNAVGINLNTASEHVLAYVSGLGPTIAKNIIDYRNEHGPFSKIVTLKKVPRMGAKSFEQCAGFLRIRKGENPLDNTAVHPERYALVKKMAKGQNIEQLISNKQSILEIDKKQYVTEEVGLPTINDIINELLKPGLDIRGSAKSFEFTPGIETIEDVKEGMRVNGVINNITNFGAFVDIGIKEAGLIHVSQMSDSFVKDPMQVVKLNQEVNARVIEVDVKRKRISLSLKSGQ